MEQKEIVDLGLKLIMYNSILDNLDDDTQDQLEQLKGESFKKFENYSEVVDKNIADNIDVIERAVVGLVKKLQNDILEALEREFPEAGNE
ncbi:hypothetical protein D3C87_324310 [compost metagenome]